MSDRPAMTIHRAALRNRALQAWDRHLGAPAWFALGAVVLALLMQFQWRPAQERARATVVQQRAQIQQEGRSAFATGPGSARDALSQALPDVATRGRDIGALLAAARQNRLVVDRADYTVESVSGAPLTRLHANIPLGGTYADVRKFVAETLNTMPNATLESLQLERPDTQSVQLQATLRIVLFYRTGR